MSVDDIAVTLKNNDIYSAIQRFAETSRSASFVLSLTIREIRMLQEQPWNQAWAMSGTDLHTLNSLIRKGLLLHVYGEPPRLSPMGRLVRELLIYSRHIVENGNRAPKWTATEFWKYCTRYLNGEDNLGWDILQFMKYDVLHKLCLSRLEHQRPSFDCRVINDEDPTVPTMMVWGVPVMRHDFTAVAGNRWLSIPGTTAADPREILWHRTLRMVHKN